MERLWWLFSQADVKGPLASIRWRPAVAGLVCLGLLVCLAGSVPAAEPCFSCHVAPGLAERIAGGKRTDPETEERLLKGKAHADVACSACHPQATVSPHPREMVATQCERCHQDVRAHVLAHGSQEPEQEGLTLPGCVNCHGYHGIAARTEPESSVHRSKVPELCATCHARPEGNAASYLASVHGRAHTRDAESPAAVCTDCHGAHPQEEGGTLLTGVARALLPHTCGKCHDDILKEYRHSVHGQAAQQGVPDVPVCTDCHGEHNILSPDAPESSVNPLRIPDTCGGCHGALPLATRHGIDPDKYETYRHSYHGIANRYGSAVVADCASCHGTHDIRPSSDPKSSIHPANLPSTCGQCHDGVNQNVVRGRTHVRVTASEAPAVYWVAFGFRWLTILTMAALVGHIILDFAKKLKLRRDARAGGHET